MFAALNLSERKNWWSMERQDVLTGVIGLLRRKIPGEYGGKTPSLRPAKDGPIRLSRWLILYQQIYRKRFDSFANE